jgi:phage terminase large subunit
MLVEIPYSPRPLQREIHAALDKHRFSVAVCHRRFGKTVLAINHLLKEAIRCEKGRPRYAYVGPTYRQAKAVAWDYLKHYAGVIPGVKFNESELRCDIGERRIQIFGADNPDALRGMYFDGAVLDEYALMQGRVFTEVIRPALSDREGWALFIGTPNGKNSFKDIRDTASEGNGWYLATYKASETNIIPFTELEAARRLMSEPEYKQEFECSFEASVKGAIYGKELDAAKEEKRITNVPHVNDVKVYTFWDLGIGDSTAIWFMQAVSQEIRFIDYYENSGEGLSHYVKKLGEKPYVYAEHYAPHDIEVRELGTGKSRLEVARSLGINFKVAPRLELEDGINATRAVFNRCWFDQGKCKAGIDALQNYRRDYNSRLDEFKAIPVHDWASHGADAFRYFAVSWKGEKKDKPLNYPKLGVV